MGGELTVSEANGNVMGGYPRGHLKKDIKTITRRIDHLSRRIANAHGDLSWDRQEMGALLRVTKMLADMVGGS